MNTEATWLVLVSLATIAAIGLMVVLSDQVQLFRAAGREVDHALGVTKPGPGRKPMSPTGMHSCQSKRR